MQKNASIFVAGHRGMVGSAICEALANAGYKHIITRTRAELDLCNQGAVQQFFASNKPTYVFLCAAKVGGIYANDTYSADFIYENLQIQNNCIHAAWKFGTQKLLFLGSSCIYPKECPQPIREEYLLSGPLESTNKAYALAKIAGITMCQSYRKQYGFNAISVMPTNLYGPHDNYHPDNAHVIPALLRRFHEAKIANTNEVAIWGSGKPRREFLHVHDLASACLFLMQNYNEEEHVNIGCGKDIPIMELASLIAKVVGFTGKIITDNTKPDGTMQKLLDVSKLQKLGWQASIPLEQGLMQTYTDFLKQENRK